MKNQFRTLDEDEVEFLDSLLESTRAREEALKKETNEQLEVFHRQRQEAEKSALASGDANDPNRVEAASPTEEEQWSIPGRKRRRTKEKDSLPGIKLRKASSGTKPASSNLEGKPAVGKVNNTKSPAEIVRESSDSTKPTAEETGKGKDGKPDSYASPSTQKSMAELPKPASSALGLGAYDSDED